MICLSASMLNYFNYFRICWGLSGGTNILFYYIRANRIMQFSHLNNNIHFGTQILLLGFLWKKYYLKQKFWFKIKFHLDGDFFKDIFSIINWDILEKSFEKESSSIMKTYYFIDKVAFTLDLWLLSLKYLIKNNILRCSELIIKFIIKSVCKMQNKNSNTPTILAKIVSVGDSGAGKTSLLSRISTNEFT